MGTLKPLFGHGGGSGKCAIRRDSEHGITQLNPQRTKLAKIRDGRFVKTLALF